MICPKQHLCAEQFWERCPNYQKPACISQQLNLYKPNKRQMNNTPINILLSGLPDGDAAIIMQPLNNSTRIKAIGHAHHQGKNYLIIEFMKGGFYAYPNIMITHKFGLLNAESPGIYFEKNIKDKAFIKLLESAIKAKKK